MSDLERTATIASRSDMGRAQRILSSTVIRLAISPRRRGLVNGVREIVRRASGAPHRVHYFHQVDDPYSHLAVQALAPLCERYAIEIVPHVAAADDGLNTPEPQLLATLARRDCHAVAPHYDLGFPDAATTPRAASLQAVERVLVAAREEGAAVFASRAVAAGEALWGGDEGKLEGVRSALPSASSAEAGAASVAGRELRAKRGHYSGAMFHYAGEWYWGVDRLQHLERRLSSLGAAVEGCTPRFPRPEIAMESVPRAGEMALEVFPSLRSPYTAIGFEPTLRLSEGTGVRLTVRPVLPMVMRGVPVTFTKGLYIMFDTLREAQLLDMPFGRMLDPIGEPVRRAYSLWPWAREQGRGSELLASFLRAAFSEGIDTSTQAGLRRVVERAGLPWDAAAERLGDDAWERELEENRLAMIHELGQWGVPSYRLRGPEGEPDLCCWGQDRLWLIAREIQRRGRSRRAQRPAAASASSHSDSTLP